MYHARAFMAVGNTGSLDKKQLTETDIRTKFITPALIRSNWDLMTQIREEAYFTNGRVIVRGKTVQRGKAKKADYLLDYKPMNFAPLQPSSFNPHPFHLAALTR